MLDLAFVRENLELVEAKLGQRATSARLDEFREIDLKRRRVLTEVETLKSRRNRESQEIAQLKQQKVDAEDRFREMRALSDQIKELDDRANALDQELRDLLSSLPNIPHSS